jgi:hypothetical protein
LQFPRSFEDLGWKDVEEEGVGTEALAVSFVFGAATELDNEAAVKGEVVDIEGEFVEVVDIKDNTSEVIDVDREAVEVAVTEVTLEAFDVAFFDVAFFDVAFFDVAFFDVAFFDAEVL